MRCLIAVVVLLLAAPLAALAADPPGGPGWYQLMEDTTLSVPFESGTLFIAGGTPGRLVGVTAGGQLRIQFERGLATSRNGEITTATGSAEAAALTVTVPPADVRAMLRQSKKAPGSGDGSDGSASPHPNRGVAAVTGGGSSGGGIHRSTTRDVIVTDTDEVRFVHQPSAAALTPPGGSRRGGTEVFPPMPSSGSGGAAGLPTRVIALDEHEEWLAKVLRLWGEDGARCQTKGYGPGWISICESRQQTPIALR